MSPSMISQTTLGGSRLGRLVHRFIPASHYLLLALLFYAGLHLVFAFHRWLVVFVTILFFITAAGIVLVRIEERGRFRSTQVILPLLAAAGLIGFGLFLPAHTLSWYFILASATLFWLLKHGAKQAYPTWNWSIATIVFFLDSAVVLGLRFHLYLPLLPTLALLLIISLLISLQALQRSAGHFADALLIAMSVSLALTQITWVLQFLPLHFVVQAGVLVIVYYVLFHLLAVSFERKLRLNDLTEYGIIGTSALLLILLTARWL